MSLADNSYCVILALSLFFKFHFSFFKEFFLFLLCDAQTKPVISTKERDREKKRCILQKKFDQKKIKLFKLI